MRKVLAFNGSPRPAGNSVKMLEALARGCGQAGASIEIIDSRQENILGCTGCLRCNVLKRCSLNGDAWSGLENKILEADVLVFASPVYFHHLPAPLKAILDRFRSFTHVQITAGGLKHSPHQVWKKEFVLLLSQGSSDLADARPIIELFEYICGIMGPGNRLHQIVGSRLAISNQIMKTKDELEQLYRKLSLEPSLAGEDFKRNQQILEDCRALGHRLSNAKPT